MDSSEDNEDKLVMSSPKKKLRDAKKQAEYFEKEVKIYLYLLLR